MAAILLDLACPDPNAHECGRQQDTKSSRLQMSAEDIYDFAYFSENIKKGWKATHSYRRCLHLAPLALQAGNTFAPAGT